MPNPMQLNRSLHLILSRVTLLIVASVIAPAALTYAQDLPADRPHINVHIDVNLRAGPGITDSVVGRAVAGDEYLVLDQEEECAWLQIAALDDTQQAAIGWITGHPAYVSLSVTCADLDATPAPVLFPTTTAASQEPARASTLLAVVVQIDGVAIRSGPSASHPTLRTVAAGEQLQTDGQIGDCKWLHVHTDTEQDGWISGNIAYSRLVGECADLPSLEPPTPTPVPAPYVSVVLDDVNIRAEASTRARVLRTAARDETFVVTGQTSDCAWLRIAVDGGAVGWISGNPAYTALDQPCATLAIVAATPTPRPTAATAPRRQGCATVTNYLGFTVRIDIVRSDGWQTSFTLAPNANHDYCVDAGVYTATLSAPSRSDRFSVPLYVNGGENYNIPLRMP
jgi:uncharacterized protein YgiM (DUF1202 family)